MELSYLVPHPEAKETRPTRQGQPQLYRLVTQALQVRVRLCRLQTSALLQTARLSPAYTSHLTRAHDGSPSHGSVFVLDVISGAQTPGLLSSVCSLKKWNAKFHLQMNRGLAC